MSGEEPFPGFEVTLRRAVRRFEDEFGRRPKPEEMEKLATAVWRYFDAPQATTH